MFGPWDREDPPEKGMAAHSSILAWRTPWTEQPSMGSQRLGHERSVTGRAEGT